MYILGLINLHKVDLNIDNMDNKTPITILKFIYKSTDSKGR